MIISWEEFMKNDMRDKIGISPSNKIGRSIESIYGLLSPVTISLLNTIINSKNKNIIILFNDKILRPIPLIASSLCSMNGQNTLVFTTDYRIGFKNLKINHYKNYCLLNSKNKWGDSSYLFNDYPIYYSEKNKIIADPYMPAANRGQSSKFKKIFEQKLHDNKIPKIFIQNNSKDLANLIKGEETTLSEHLLKNKKNNVYFINVVFEHFDKYVKSKESCDNFIKWAKTRPKHKYVIHFSQESKYIDYIKENLDCIVIPYNLAVLANSNLRRESLKYFDNIDSHEYNIIKKYNLDEKHLHILKDNISICEELIESGNMDNYFKNIVYTIKNDINHDDLAKKNFFYAMTHFLYSLSNLSINPSSFKIYVKSFRDMHLTFNAFSNMYLSSLDNETLENQQNIEHVLFLLSNMYNQLSRTKRYNQEESYSKIGKDYKILDIAANKEKYFKKDKKLIIATLFKTEPAILNKDIEKAEIEDVEAIYINNLGKNSFNKDKSEYNLLIPGIVKKQFFRELNENYEEILFLAYDGTHANLVREQIDRFLNRSMEEEIKYMSYFEEIYTLFKLSKEKGFMGNYKRRVRKYRKEQKENTIETHSEDEKIESIIITPTSFLDDWEMSDVNRKINYSPQNTSKYYKKLNEKTINVQLKNIKNNEVIQKELPITRSYFSFSDTDEMDEGEEKFPINFSIGEHIVLIGGDERKSMLDIIDELNQNHIKIELIEYWKVQLINYIAENKLKYKQFYNLYTGQGGKRHYQTVLKWAKGEVIGPMQVEDLFLIGKTINDEFIIEKSVEMINEINKIRTHHKHFGRKLKKIINEIMSSGGFDSINLTEEEYDIYKYIDNGIYEVVWIDENSPYLTQQ